ncbi:DUF2334 domain-containing protein [Gorillibacterium sp. sgz5001074]|uniref:DUF2334 domain-containing protein n=1 Tax=Gorillibacterium sp. sgz5001074 TaxID=3446695 RepID=UPI003F66B62D
MRVRVSLMKIVLSFVFLSSSWSLYHLMVVSGESTGPRAVLLRLEDVGPGGEYGNAEQLGKLRAVFDYLHKEGVPFQVGVIPKWVNYSDTGLQYDKSIDQTSDPYIASFVQLLRDAETNGAVLGMHGYTHQAGTVKRADGHQESGIGNEMDEPGLPETSTREFAEARLQAGFKLFWEAGLEPAFWETPHYHSAAAQHDVFRSYFGIIYETMPGQPRQTAMMLHPGRNSGYGAATWGAAYVPTPYSYIPYNKDERLILDQLGKSDRLPSFFYHAFLEFKHLIPVLDEEGRQAVQDGLPLFKYPDQNKTNLQKLVAGFRDRNYNFVSLHDYVPFVPGPSAPAGLPGVPAKWADADGDGQLDGVQWQTGSGVVRVTPGQYRGLRNAAEPKSADWAVIPRSKGDLFTLKDENGDGRADLWIFRPAGQLELYRSTGASFIRARTWKVPAAELEELYMLKRKDGSLALAGSAANGSQLIPYWKQDDAWKIGEPAKSRAGSFKGAQILEDPAGGEQLVRCRKDTGICYRLELPAGKNKWNVTRQDPGLPRTGEELKLGDFNGDGREDVLLWNGSGNLAVVYRQAEDGSYHLLFSFGPWGDAGAKPVVADFDGDGRDDLGAVEPDGRMDAALSRQTMDDVQ